MCELYNMRVYTLYMRFVKILENSRFSCMNDVDLKIMYTKSLIVFFFFIILIIILLCMRKYSKFYDQVLILVNDWCVTYKSSNGLGKCLRRSIKSVMMKPFLWLWLFSSDSLNAILLFWYMKLFLYLILIFTYLYSLICFSFKMFIQ